MYVHVHVLSKLMFPPSSLALDRPSLLSVSHDLGASEEWLETSSMSSRTGMEDAMSIGSARSDTSPKHCIALYNYSVSIHMYCVVDLLLVVSAKEEMSVSCTTISCILRPFSPLPVPPSLPPYLPTSLLLCRHNGQMNSLSQLMKSWRCWSGMMETAGAKAATKADKRATSLRTMCVPCPQVPLRPRPLCSS